MKTREKTKWIGLVLLMSLALEPLALGDDKAVSDPVSEWQEAAFNYEYAADAQESAAESVLEQADDVRNTFQEDVAKTRRNKVQSGNLQLRAADLILAASTNLDNAARVWRQAASVTGRETAAGQYFVAAGQAATTKSMGFVRRSVDLCEQAAVVFAEEDEFLSQAGANQKAAGLRERLAKRKAPFQEVGKQDGSKADIP